MPLRLKWSYTWPEVKADFHSHDEAGNPVGRIYKTISSPTDEYRWFWTAYGQLPGSRRSVNKNGHALSKKAAAEAVEAAWFEAIEDLARAR